MDNVLEQLKHEFQHHTNVHVNNAEQVYGWYKLYISEMNCEELERVARYIRFRFSTPGNYSHILPKITTFNGSMCLSVDVERTKEKFK